MTVLEYSSWLFQLIVILAIIYLVVGLVQPSMVRASSRSAVAVASIIALLLASTAFYFIVVRLPGGRETPAEISAETPTPPPAQ